MKTTVPKSGLYPKSDLLITGVEKPPIGTLVWVTNGFGLWAKAQLCENGNWSVKSNMDDYVEFDFNYWCPLEERDGEKNMIKSFKKWYKNLDA